jgi:hypothetical protein
MAYGDYGGYAYLNGIHIAERSDTSIKIDSTTEIDGHVVLGDGPIYIVLYKQYAIIYSGGEQLKRFSYPLDITDDRVINEFLNIHHHNISIYLTHEDNYYVYAKLEQPNGNTWYGFSGYGVGAGLEDAGYGYSTEDRIDALSDLFPDIFQNEPE